MKKVLLKHNLILSVAAWSAIFSFASSRAAHCDTVNLQTFPTHSRLVFHLDQGVAVQSKNSVKGFDLFLPGVGLADLGAPLGEEEQWKSQYEALAASKRDPRLGRLQISEVAGGVKVHGEWKYPVGPQAPAHPSMEIFEYRDQDQASYIIDFWPKGGLTVAELQFQTKHNAEIAAQKKVELSLHKRAERRLASEKRQAQLEDLTKFCREPLKDSTDIFLTFHPVHEPLSLGRWFSLNNPDSGFEYFEPTGEKEDAQYVRLALKLYSQGKLALVLRTIDFFDHEHPNSAYHTEMSFLRSNALIKLHMVPEAEAILNRLLIESKDSAEAVYAAIYLAGNQMTKGSYLAALESFMWLIQNHPDHRMAWLFHMGAAESLYSLKQTERASKEYEWVVENAKSPSDQAQAAMRAGDLYLDRLQYDQALAGYAQAARNFPGEIGMFPALNINRGESLYGVGQYKEAKQVFEDFLKKHPTHPAAWRAAYRLGEIEARDANPESQKNAREHFYDTVNRYPFTPGATLARLRLLPCGDHAGFSPDLSEKFFSNEAEKFDGAGEVHLNRYSDLVALAHVRTLVSMNREELAVQTALDELKKNPSPNTREMLNGILAGVFRRSVLNMLAQGKGYDALTFYQEKSSPLPRDSNLVEPDYLLKLSQTASDFGLGNLAEEILSKYKGVSAARSLAAQNDPEIAQDPETELRVSEQKFTEAKALWIRTQGKGEYAGQIRGLLSQVNAESRFSYEREIILGLLDQKAGKNSSALMHAAQAQVLSSDSNSVDESISKDARLEAWLASLEATVGSQQNALNLYRNVEKHLRLKNSTTNVTAKAEDSAPTAAAILGVPATPPVDQLVVAQAKILETQGHWGEVASTYNRELDKGIGAPQFMYEYARALIKTGSPEDRAKGFETLKKIAEAPAPSKAEKVESGETKSDREPARASETAKGDDFWRKLASETLADENIRSR